MLKFNAALADQMNHPARRWQRLGPGLVPRTSTHSDYGREAIVADSSFSATWPE